MYQQDLIQQINEKTAVIGVIGMGYVGLPLALTFVDNEFSVIGFDIDEIKIDDLNNGTSYISHIDDKEVLQSLKTGRFRATIDFSLLAEVDAILICVPTPLTPEREPDLSFVISTAETIARHLRKGHLIVLESTTYPGCTETILKPRLEANNLSSGKDFFLAYSPEREDPGNPEYATAHIPKVVGGNDVEALKLAITLYDQIVVQTVPVSSMEVAEAVKLTENVFRSVNIALVNELKMIYQKIGVDVWEVIEAAKTKPFG
ncbi:MAG: UDP-N-acetyl-D-glucosamine dehydrogenase, partial [Rhodospirillaceae bacterium TMED167]